jgi:hypothetical protein
MRQVTVTSPEGKGSDVARIAFGAGIGEVSIHKVRRLGADGSETAKDKIEIETGTALAKAFIDKLTTASFFDREDYTVAVRQPRSIISGERLRILTRPLVEPGTDLFEELWQFCQVTYGFIGRIYLGAVLLAFGLIDYRLLFMIAGLLFIPLLPLMLGVGFGVWTRQWRLVGQALFALAVAMSLLVAGGVTVALLSDPPLRYLESNSLLTGFLISLVVGVAAGLATADDVGRREMIGLAATAQVAIIPAWFGICFVFGFPAFDSSSARQRLLSLALNIATIIIASAATYAALRVKGASLRVFDMSQKAVRSES